VCVVQMMYIHPDVFGDDCATDLAILDQGLVCGEVAHDFPGD
jgi:hypothetical protein